MRILSSCVLVLWSCALTYAANEEFPAKLRGLWGDNKETCEVFRTYDPAALREDQKWLKIAATNVLGSLQGRFFREVPSQMIAGASAEMSFEIQSLDESGSIIRLTLSADGRLHEMIGAGVESGNYQRC